MSGWPRIGVEPCEKLAVHIKVLDLCCLIAVLRADTGLRLRRRDIKAERNGVLVHRHVLHGCVIEVADGNVQMLVQQLFDLGVGKAPDDSRLPCISMMAFTSSNEISCKRKQP